MALILCPRAVDRYVVARVSLQVRPARGATSSDMQAEQANASSLEARHSDNGASRLRRWPLELKQRKRESKDGYREMTCYCGISQVASALVVDHDGRKRA